jgi:hypothetical protein
METPIRFDASDCLKSMAGVGQLPLLVSPTIANVKLYHVLIDGGVALNLISPATFKKLQIMIGKLQLSCPFSGVGPMSVMPSGCISLPVTFRTAENFHTESILFDVTVVSLPFNAILGRPALYQFMAVTHYGYLVLKMPSPSGVLKIRETVMQVPVHWKSSRLWRHRERPLLNLGGEILPHRAHASVAWLQHPACNPLPRRMSP